MRFRVDGRQKTVAQNGETEFRPWFKTFQAEPFKQDFLIFPANLRPLTILPAGYIFWIGIGLNEPGQDLPLDVGG